MTAITLRAAADDLDRIVELALAEIDRIAEVVGQQLDLAALERARGAIRAAHADGLERLLKAAEAAST